MPSLNFCSPPYVQKAFKKLSKKNRILVTEKLKQFQDNPEHFSTFLKGPLAGKRKVRVKKDLRVVLAICRECRQFGHRDKNNCADCCEHGDNDVIIFNIGTHKEVY